MSTECKKYGYYCADDSFLCPRCYSEHTSGEHRQTGAQQARQDVLGEWACDNCGVLAVFSDTGKCLTCAQMAQQGLLRQQGQTQDPIRECKHEFTQPPGHDVLICKKICGLKVRVDALNAAGFVTTAMRADALSDELRFAYERERATALHNMNIADEAQKWRDEASLRKRCVK